MKEVDIISKVVGRQGGGAVNVPSVGSSPSVDLSGYLLKKVWDEAFELKEDANGVPYLFGKLNLVVAGGITMYAEGDGVDIPSIYAGLPIDGTTIYWDGGFLKAQGGGIGGGITDITSSMVVSALGYTPANASDLTTLQSTVNDFLSGSDTDSIINKWKELEAFLSGLSESDNLATILGTKANKATTLAGYGIADAYTKSDVNTLLGDYVTLATAQTITGKKDFTTGGLFVNGKQIQYIPIDGDSGYWKLEGDLLVTGGITMFANEGTYTPSTIMDGLVLDSATLGINDEGQLYVKGGTGGGSIEGLATVATTGKYSDLIGVPTLLSSFTDDVGYRKNIVTYTGTDADAAETLTYSEMLGYSGLLSGFRYIETKFYQREDTSANRMQIAYGYDKDAIEFRRYYNGAWSAWKEIVFSSTLAGYLPLSGGTVTGAINLSANAVDVLRIGNGIGAMSFQNVGTGSSDFTSIYVMGRGQLIFTDTSLTSLKYRQSGTSTNHTVWHAGNDGSGSGLDADLLDGIQESSLYRSYREHIAAAELDSFVARDSGGYSVSQSGYSGLLVHFAKYNQGSVSSLDLYVPHYDFVSYGLRARISVDSGREADWRTFAFTDSNVASATKLHTARTIWGQSFDGSANVDGNIVSANTTFNVFANTTKELLSYSTQNKYLSIGYSTLASQYITYLHGYSMSLRYGSSGTDGIVLNSSGNVGIGNASPTTGFDVKKQSMEIGVSVYGSGGVASQISMSTHREGSLYCVRGMQMSASGSATGIFQSFLINSINYGTKTNLMSLDSSGNGLFYGGITMYSDIRKKTKLQDVELSLSQIANAPLIEYYYNSDDKRTTHVGSIAQYWAEMNDWFCKKDQDGFYTMEIQNAALASAISVARHLQKYETKTDRTIRKLKKRICELEDEMEKLKSK